MGDIDWERAEIQVSGKGRRQTRLPLTQEVGDALVAYLKDGRPPTDTDVLFIRSRAPFRAFASHCAISVIVTQAMRRAGVTCQSRGAAHVLRHSAATSMLRQGASLQDIATILRHRSIETTQIYAKVDVTALLTDCTTLAGGAPMLAQVVESYLTVRRACGFELKTQGNLLRSFAIYSDDKGKHHVCSEVAIEWAGLAPSVYQRARRLGHVIRFARYVRAEDQSHELPPAVFGSENRPRPTPYIFSQDNIQRLVQAASESGYRSFRRKTYSTLFALLACTGLRVSEAIRLRFEDITPDGLVIKRTKFRKSRLVPLARNCASWTRTLSRTSPPLCSLR